MSSSCHQHTKLTHRLSSMSTWPLTLLFALILTILQPNIYANPYLSPYTSFNKSKDNKENGNSWQTLKNCRLVEDKGNDGDSFRVLHKNKEYVFRLYMVDCPETKYDYNERILKQMQYFNQSHQEIVQVGEIAKELAKTLLKKPFTVYTRGEDAMGSKGNTRIYGFVVISTGKDLGEILLKEGLARSFGKAPSGPTINPRVRTNYDSAQKQAQRKRHGAWTKSNEGDIKRGPETTKTLTSSSIKTAINIAQETSKSGGLKAQTLLESIKNKEDKDTTTGGPSIFNQNTNTKINTKNETKTNVNKKTGRTNNSSKKEERYTISKEELETLLPKAKEIDYQTHKNP